jgi:YVTN family beta-propeller protein
MNSRSRTARPHNPHPTALALHVLIGAIAILAHAAFAQNPSRQPSSGLINPRAIAFSPATGKVYAVDTSNGAVQIYNDSLQQSHHVKVGAAPVSIAVNAVNGRVYVANAGDGTVSVLDGNSDTVVATIQIGSHPYSIAANAVTGKVYVTHTFGDRLSILDGATNTFKDLKTGSADLIAINSETNTIYMLEYGGAVTALDGASQQLSVRPVGDHAWGLALNEITNAVYVTRIESADLAGLNGASTTPVILPAGAIPCAIAINPKTNTLYIANDGDNTVTVIDATAGRAHATIPVGDRPKSIAYDADRNLVYVANTRGNSVTVIDAANYAVLAAIPAGRNPYALAVVPGSTRLYVANEWDQKSSTVVDLSQVHLPGKSNCTGPAPCS